MTESPKLIYLPAGAMEPRDAMRIYELLGAEGIIRRLYWFEQHLPEAERGSQRSFLKLFDEASTVLIGDPARVEVLGLMWFTNETPFRAHASVCYRSQMPRELRVETTVRAIHLASQEGGWRDVWCETPYENAMRHAEAAGAKLVATLPDYAQMDGARHPLYILKGRVSHG